MASNGTTANGAYRNGRHAARPSSNDNGKGNKFTNAGAAAGGFMGALGGSFVPPLNITVNNNRGGGHNGSSRPRPETLLPAPEFLSPAQTRQYCNTLRAAAVALSIEVAMGAEILEGVLTQVPDPEGKPFGSRRRAKKVARKLRKSADSLQSAAKNAAATYSLYQQEFQEEINRVRHRARKPQRPVVNWADQ